MAGAVIGAALEVHRNPGPGFLENIYEHALAIELAVRGILFERQKTIGVSYKGYEIGEYFSPYLRVLAVKIAFDLQLPSWR